MNESSISHLTIECHPQDFPLCCPSLQETVWSAHPRVYLSLDDKGKVSCPYCSTIYQRPSPGKKAG